DGRLDAVANGDLEAALVVLQFADVDLGFALAAHVDERHLGADRDDRALDGLALLVVLRLQRSLEHGGEILLGLTHVTLLDYPREAASGSHVRDTAPTRRRGLRRRAGAPA